MRIFLVSRSVGVGISCVVQLVMNSIVIIVVVVLLMTDLVVSCSSSTEFRTEDVNDDGENQRDEAGAASTAGQPEGDATGCVLEGCRAVVRPQVPVEEADADHPAGEAEEDEDVAEDVADGSLREEEDEEPRREGKHEAGSDERDEEDDASAGGKPGRAGVGVDGENVDAQRGAALGPDADVDAAGLRPHDVLRRVSEEGVGGDVRDDAGADAEDQEDHEDPSQGLGVRTRGSGCGSGCGCGSGGRIGDRI